MLPPIARRFVAGESEASALEHAQETNERGVSVILNLLGEHHDDPAAVETDAAAYRGLIDDIADADLDACISVKPTQLGLDLGEDVFRQQLTGVVRRGVDRGVFVWIDMEDHTTTDATLDAYEELAREHGGRGRSTDGSASDAPDDSAADAPDDSAADGGVGVCLQANLRRTREDVERLADVPGAVRFTKGAYDEPAAIAYRDRQRVTRELLDLLEYAFEHFDGGIAVGSHDPEVIDHAIALREEYDTDVEFQMLMGVREDAQFELAAAGHEVWQYAPYGRRWKSYFYRRLRERKENLWFALRAIVGR